MRLAPFYSASQGRWATGLCAGLLSFGIVLAGCDSNGDDGGDVPDNPTIAERASNQDNLSTLAGPLEKAGLDEKPENPFCERI